MTESAKITTPCPQCGASITYYRSWPRKFCSNRCKGIALAGNLGTHMRPNTAASRICEECHAPMTGLWYVGRRFCSRACFGQWLKRNMAPTFQGGQKPITRVTIDCATCERPFEVKKSHAARRRCCSLPCMSEWRKGRFTGVNNGAWKGGYLPYYGASWRVAQREVRARDTACVDCGRSPKEIGRALDIHHVKLFRSFGVERHEEANATTNLVGLCFRCHSNRPEHHA